MVQPVTVASVLDFATTKHSLSYLCFLTLTQGGRHYGTARHGRRRASVYQSLLALTLLPHTHFSSFFFFL
jgi:hypothetical protein